MRRPFLAACLALAFPAAAADRAATIADPDTQAWWRATEVLSSDAMEGRDIGSPGHEKAGRWVAEQFRAAGLKPAGDNGSFFQTFPLHESRVEAADLRIADDHGPWIQPTYLQHISVRSADDLPPHI